MENSMIPLNRSDNPTIIQYVNSRIGNSGGVNVKRIKKSIFRTLMLVDFYVLHSYQLLV